MSRTDGRSGPKPQTRGGQEGIALVVVLWAVALLSVLLLALLQEWQLETRLQADFLQKRRCRHLAEAGFHYTIGKIMALKQAEADPEAAAAGDLTLWRPDGTVNRLEWGDDRLEIRIFDEGGKINLNRAGAEILINLFMALGYNEAEAAKRVRAILSWRGSDFLLPQSRPDYSFYLQQIPPYRLKNKPFDTVEEVRWVWGCADLSPRLVNEIFTVQEVEANINLNAAGRPVLEALGLPGAAAAALEQLRSQQLLENFEALSSSLGLDPLFQFRAPISFRSSDRFTILATGSSAAGVRQSLKAIVRVHPGQPEPWTVLYWHDDYPE